jgi:hypothetical protein
MQIVSKSLKIKRIDDISTEYIENELKCLNIELLRWAVVDFDEEFLTVSYSCY